VLDDNTGSKWRKPLGKKHKILNENIGLQYKVLVENIGLSNLVA